MGVPSVMCACRFGNRRRGVGQREESLYFTSRLKHGNDCAVSPELDAVWRRQFVGGGCRLLCIRDSPTSSSGSDSVIFCATDVELLGEISDGTS